MHMLRTSLWICAAWTMLAVAGSARAQCNVTPPAGAVQTSDGCGGGLDANGGCGVSPPAFTDLGSLSAGSSINVVGQIGTFDTNGSPNSTEARDLDWMVLTTPTAGKLKLSLAARNNLNQPQARSVIFVARNVDIADPCPATFQIAIESPACPHLQELYVGAGTHLIAVTTPLDTPGSVQNRCGSYLLNVALEALQYPVCGTSDEPCVMPHAARGCENIRCCERACAFDPSCCLTAWDADCANYAVVQCGLFLYGCQTAGGAPENDCATNPRDIVPGQAGVIVANATATTDGPGPGMQLCEDAMGKDLWYRIQSPGNGRLTLSMCGSAPAGDSVVEVYRLGTDPSIDAARAQSLPDAIIGCADDTCGNLAGTEEVTILDARQGEYYLIRIGGWYNPLNGGPETAATFSHRLDSKFEYLIYSTGPQQRLRLTSTGAPIDVGLGSGCPSQSQPNRWLAMPWTAPPAPGASSWRVSTITAKGFTPVGATNTTLNFVVWNRNGTARPTEADQRASGTVPFPVPYDQSGDYYPDASHDIAADFEVTQGDYYLTVYGSNPSCPTVPSNFSWLVMARDGISFVDNAGPFAWRSATFPTPGFERWTLSGYTVLDGEDPNDIVNCVFDIFGTPNVPPCLGDLNGDGQVSGLDLTTLLAGWGTAEGDLNADGTTDGLDLTVMLAAWGACP